MILHISKIIVFLFGLFIIFSGFLMLFHPHKTRGLLKKFASTNIINYSEITIRLIVSVALIICADVSKLPEIFNILGWFMLITALILYVVPKRVHHQFSLSSAKFIKPLYFQLISPFALLFGVLIIFNLTF